MITKDVLYFSVVGNATSLDAKLFDRDAANLSLCKILIGLDLYVMYDFKKGIVIVNIPYPYTNKFEALDIIKKKLKEFSDIGSLDVIKKGSNDTETLIIQCKLTEQATLKFSMRPCIM